MPPYNQTVTQLDIVQLFSTLGDEPLTQLSDTELTQMLYKKMLGMHYVGIAIRVPKKIQLQNNDSMRVLISFGQDHAQGAQGEVNADLMKIILVPKNDNKQIEYLAFPPNPLKIPMLESKKPSSSDALSPKASKAMYSISVLTTTIEGPYNGTWETGEYTIYAKSGDHISNTETILVTSN